MKNENIMQKFISEFIEVYTDKELFNTIGLTYDKLLNAIQLHLDGGANFEGDSFDREQVRDILAEKFEVKFNYS